MKLRALRRDRASRSGVELFLHERAFADCLDRIGLIRRRFRSALLIGCPDSDWPERLKDLVDHVDILDPGAAFAAAAGGRRIVEDELVAEPGAYDLCVAIGTLDTVNDLRQALARIRLTLGPSAFLLGAVAGGDTLPQLRGAMRAADQVRGPAVPHVHPRIEAAALAPLLSAAGFTMPVVDVDRVQVSYESLHAIDRRSARNGGDEHSFGPLAPPAGESRTKRRHSRLCVRPQNGRTTETFEILHFGAWTAPDM